MNWTPIVLTLKLAGLTALILVAVGMPIAYWLTYSRWRWKFLAESVVALPLVLPPTVLGFYVLVAVGPNRPLGPGYQALVRPPLALTLQGLPVASVLYNLPLVVPTLAAGVGSVDSKR